MAQSDINNIILNYIDAHKLKFIQLLRDAVEIPSVTKDLDKRKYLMLMAIWLKKRMVKYGLKADFYWLNQRMEEGMLWEQPPVIIGQNKRVSRRLTICFCGHYGIEPASKEHGWEHNPFKLKEVEGHLFGRGTCYYKGPILCWLSAIKAYQACEIPLPINIKFVFEGITEKQDEEFYEFLGNNKLFSNVDSVCISDSQWFNHRKPCLTYGYVGNCFFSVQISCAQSDVSSSYCSGTINEAMADLLYLLNELVNNKANILIPNIYQDIESETKEEMKRFKSVDFNIFEFKKKYGIKQLLFNEDKKKILLHLWKRPSLSIHGIEGCFSDSEINTVIPCEVTGKFSIKIVSNQSPKKIEDIVLQYLHNLWIARGSKNEIHVSMTSSTKPWITDLNDESYKRAENATHHVYNMDPDYMIDGLPTEKATKMENVMGNCVVLIPLNPRVDDYYDHNDDDNDDDDDDDDDEEESETFKENISATDYINGIKFVASYLAELGEILKDDDSTKSEVIHC